MIDDHFQSGPCSAQLNAVHRISAALFAQAGVDTMLRETLEVSMQTVEAEAGSILLYDRDSKQLTFRHALGPEGAKLVGRAVNLQGSGKCATVFKTGESDISVEGFDHPIDIQVPTRCTLTTAIKNFGGQPIGVVQVLNKTVGVFNQRDRELLEIVAAMAATVIENARRAEIEKQAALARILAYLAHDLKNQAFIIDIALHNAESEAELRSMVATANAKATRLSRAMNEYAKGKALFEFEPNDLKATLVEELEQLVTLAAKHGDVVDLSGVRQVPTFPFDKVFIGRAAFNLVQNALQAIRLFERPGTITVNAEYHPAGTFPNGGYAQISVSDNGPGMPRAKLERILEGMADPDDTRQDSAGVGTRIVRDVALTHGGQFLGESAPGRGSTFRIRLPLNRGTDNG